MHTHIFPFRVTPTGWLSMSVYRQPSYHLVVQLEDAKMQPCRCGKEAPNAA